MGFIILILLVIIIFVIVKKNKNPKDSSTQTSNQRQNKPQIGIDLSVVPTYNPVQLMVMLGCLTYYECILRNPIFLIAGMKDRETTQGISISLKLDNLRNTLHFVPDDLAAAVNLFPWTVKTETELEMEYPTYDKNDFFNQRNDYVKFFVEGMQVAQKCSGNFLGVDKPREVYVLTPNPNNEHFLIIDSHSLTGGPYDKEYKRIF